MDSVTIAVFCQLNNQTPTLLFMITTANSNLLAPKEILARAGLIPSVFETVLCFETNFYNKLRTFAAIARSSIHLSDGEEIVIPNQEIEIPQMVQSNSLPLQATLQRLQSIDWISFFALLAQRPNNGDGLCFEARGKQNFVNVEGRYFRVSDIQTRPEWIVTEVSQNSSVQAPVNVVLFNPAPLA